MLNKKFLAAILSILSLLLFAQCGSKESSITSASSSSSQTIMLNGYSELPSDIPQSAPQLGNSGSMRAGFRNATVTVAINDSTVAQTTTNSSGYFSCAVPVVSDTADILVTCSKNNIKSYNYVQNLVKNSSYSVSIDSSSSAVYETAKQLRTLSQNSVSIKEMILYLSANSSDSNIKSVLNNVKNLIKNSYISNQDIAIDTNYTVQLKLKLRDIGSTYIQYIKSRININSTNYIYCGIPDSAVILDTSANIAAINNEIARICSSSNYSQYLTSLTQKLTCETIKTAIRGKGDRWGLVGRADNYTAVISGRVSGTMTLTLNGINYAPFSFESITASFNNFCETYFLYNGNMSISLSDTVLLGISNLADSLNFNLADSYVHYLQLRATAIVLPLKYSIITDSFSIARADTYMQFNGIYTFSVDASFANFHTISNYLCDVNNSFMIKFDSYIVTALDTNTAFETGGTKIMTYNGTIKHSEIGAVTVATSDSFIFYYGTEFPVSGQAIFFFSNGKIRLTAISQNTVQIEYARVSENYTLLYTGSWSGVKELFKCLIQ